MKDYSKYIADIIKRDPKLKEELEIESWIQEIGIQIRFIRAKKGYTQTQLAKRAKMTQESIARIEGGQDCKLSTLYRLSKALDEEINIFGAQAK